MPNLIKTKLTVPGPPSALVSRPDLLRRLRRLTSGVKLALVSAPAGSGKSTLLGLWLRQLDRPAAWLSLEPSENELERFLNYLIAAVYDAEPHLGPELREGLSLGGVQEAGPIITQLLNRLTELGNPLVIVLDDYHVITNARVHAATELFLEHLPPQVCLVLGTRTDPPFGLSRLRVRGQLIEVRGDALRFSAEEANTLLNGHYGLGLSKGAVASLEGRTEGWVAGLQLAALSLADRHDKEAFVADLAGSHLHFAAYLFSEVFGGQPAGLQLFLQRTALLDRLTVPLCEAVVGRPVEAEQLRALAAKNLFLIPLDNTGTWYRYHHLFAEFLRHRLGEAEPNEIGALHGRASRWFEANGWTDEAIEHALLAGDAERAAALVESVAFTLGVTWNNAQLIRYVQRLPTELLPHRPRLCIYYTWALTNAGQLGALEAALPLLAASEAHAEHPHTVRACLLALQAYAELRRLDFAATDARCQEALALLEPAEGPLSDEERFLLVAAGNLRAYNALNSDLQHADRLYPTVLERSERLGNFIGAANSYARWGRVKHRLGQLHAAHSILTRGLNALEGWRDDKAGSPRVVNASELHISRANLFYEWNRLADAEAELARARDLNRFAQFPPVQALEFRVAFGLALAQGDLTAARGCLEELDEVRTSVRPGNRLLQEMFSVIATELRLRLAARVPNEAQTRAPLREVAGWLELPSTPREDAFALKSHAYLFVLLLRQQGRFDEALRLLLELGAEAERAGRIDDLIRYLILQALTEHALGRTSPALEHALALAEPEGYRRRFLDHGPPLRTLLINLPQRATPYLKSLLAEFTPHGSEPRTPLNERQQEILRLLAAGYSDKEIARGLELSPNTVKWYVRNLCAALGVRTRTKAVHRARELGLAS